MFESRCGVCCSSCSKKEEVNCSGCTEIKVPFWGGECKVKSCCEGKNLNFCGECTSFPCEMLSNMGKGEGYDSSLKIEQCRRWKEEK